MGTWSYVELVTLAPRVSAVGTIGEKSCCLQNIRLVLIQVWPEKSEPHWTFEIQQKHVELIEVENQTSTLS